LTTHTVLVELFKYFFLSCFFLLGPNTLLSLFSLPRHQLWKPPSAKAPPPLPSRAGGGHSSGASGGGGGMGDGGAAVIAEVALVKSEVAEFRSEVKKDLKVTINCLELPL
jgi:hypothetical protein